MRPIFRVTVVIAAVAAAISVAAPAAADTDGPRCPLAMFFICAALPSMPDLDHDVDLTKDSDVIDATGGGAGGGVAPP